MGRKPGKDEKKRARKAEAAPDGTGPLEPVGLRRLSYRDLTGRVSRIAVDLWQGLEPEAGILTVHLPVRSGLAEQTWDAANAPRGVVRVAFQPHERGEPLGAPGTHDLAPEMVEAGLRMAEIELFTAGSAIGFNGIERIAPEAPRARVQGLVQITFDGFDYEDLGDEGGQKRAVAVDVELVCSGVYKTRGSGTVTDRDGKREASIGRDAFRPYRPFDVTESRMTPRAAGGLAYGDPTPHVKTATQVSPMRTGKGRTERGENSQD